MFKAFKEFAIKGNVMDMAVGIIIGAAFTKIVDSMVKDIIMPPVGLLMGGVDFSDRFVSLSGQSHATLKAAKDAGAVTVNYGLFLNTVVQFLIVAFVVFLLVRQINRLRTTPEPEPTLTKECEYCVSTIAVAAKRCPNCTSELSAS